jgi:hypothetical protein
MHVDERVTTSSPQRALTGASGAMGVGMNLAEQSHRSLLGAAALRFKPGFGI